MKFYTKVFSVNFLGLLMSKSFYFRKGFIYRGNTGNIQAFVAAANDRIIENNWVYWGGEGGGGQHALCPPKLW